VCRCQLQASTSHCRGVSVHLSLVGWRRRHSTDQVRHSNMIVTSRKLTCERLRPTRSHTGIADPPSRPRPGQARSCLEKRYADASLRRSIRTRSLRYTAHPPGLMSTYTCDFEWTNRRAARACKNKQETAAHSVQRIQRYKIDTWLPFRTRAWTAMEATVGQGAGPFPRACSNDRPNRCSAIQRCTPSSP
jgi:hypothetical protein